jgi:hypothetical protein
MQVVYDDMKTLCFSGGLKASFSNDVTIEVNSVNTQHFSGRSLNLPCRLNSSLDVAITEKLYRCFKYFMLEKERLKDKQRYHLYRASTTSYSKGYFDANAHVGYKFNTQLTGFVRANNIANQGYQKNG